MSGIHEYIGRAGATSAFLLAAGCSTFSYQPAAVDILESRMLQTPLDNVNRQPASAEDWNRLGTWSDATPKAEKDYWSSAGRNQDLQNRYDALEGRGGIITAVHCIPLYEAVEIAKNPNAYAELELSYEQNALIRTIEEMLITPMGKAVIDELLETYADVILGIDNYADKEMGYYQPWPNAAFLNMKAARQEARPTNMQDARIFSIYLSTLAEELMHARQFNSPPCNHRPSKNLEYRRADEKIWDLAIESQARLVGMCIMTQAMLSDESALFSPESDVLTPPENMFARVKEAYAKHGLKALNNNPTPLFPAFLAFFEDTEMMKAYGHENPGGFRVNVIDPLNVTAIETEQFTAAFGCMPGMTGNMLYGQLSAVEDIFKHVAPGTTLTSWLAAAYEAHHTGQPAPDLLGPPGAESVTMAAMDDEEPLFDPEVGPGFVVEPIY